MGAVMVAIDPGKSAGIAVFRDRELVRVLAVDGDDAGVARRIIEAQNFEFEGTRLPVTVSVGIGTMTASTNPPVQDSADLVNRADQYLYKAKRGGRNRVEGCALE